MKVAVIGTGISGNVAAYHLARHHDLTVFEANDYVGGHTHTHDINWKGVDYPIDSGFIVYNERTYPNFIALLDELGVASQPTTMSFSVKNEQTGLEYNGHSLNTLFSQRRNLLSPAFHRMIRDILRFNRDATESLARGELDICLGDYLKQGEYSDMFIQQYILPMGAAIWSTDPQQMQSFPARLFISFFDHHGLLSVKDRPAWRVIKGGSRGYLKPLTDSFKDRIRLKSPVTSIRRLPGHVEVQTYSEKVENFDAVFIAAHSDQALRMLADPSREEQSILGTIRYQENEATIHTDERVLPASRRAWAAWNYHVQENTKGRVAVTYNMNILQSIQAPVQFCVTLNNDRAVSRKHIIKKIIYEHPIYTPDTVSAQQRQSEINGVQRTYYCGAYWRNGFHEDGVVSAMKALEHFEEDQNEQLSLHRSS